jgi:hypothetical protein
VKPHGALLAAFGLALGLALSACGMLGGGAGAGGGARARESVLDEQLESERRNAALAFGQGRFDQARQLYRQALGRARIRDDGVLLGDIGYDLAVTELRRGEDAESLATARAAQAELARRGLPVFAELRLVEAAALYRLERREAAEAVARPVAEGGDGAARRARFLLGLLAADRGDAAALDARIAALGEPTTGEWQADRAELEGRAAALRGDGGAAIRHFLAASDLRRAALDYPSMARALAAAGDVAGRTGDAARAADLYLRAGRSLLLADLRPGVAARWLAEAERFARSAGDAAILEAIADLRARRG